MFEFRKKKLHWNNSCAKISFDNMSALISIQGSAPTDDEPVSEPMMALSTDPHMRYSASAG